jgi:hypothetical protein
VHVQRNPTWGRRCIQLNDLCSSYIKTILKDQHQPVEPPVQCCEKDISAAMLERIEERKSIDNIRPVLGKECEVLCADRNIPSIFFGYFQSENN